MAYAYTINDVNMFIVFFFFSSFVGYIGTDSSGIFSKKRKKNKAY